MVDNQGQRANKSGQRLEQQVENIICKFDVIATKDLTNFNNLSINRILYKNVPYTNMYGGGSKGEFVLSIYGTKIRIECRCQNVRGSVDEKYPYLLGNGVSCNENIVILVLDGDGARIEAKNWLINNAKNVSTKKVKVMGLTAFKNWADKILC